MSDTSLKAPKYFRDPEEGSWDLSIDNFWIQIWMSYPLIGNVKENLFPMKYNGRTYESFKYDKDFNYEEQKYHLLIKDRESFKTLFEQKDIVGLENSKNIAKEFIKEKVLSKLKKIESFFK